MTVARSHRVVVMIGLGDRRQWLTRESEVRLGSVQTWRLPALRSHVSGAARTMPFGTAFVSHGWAGPRVLLRSLDAGGFDHVVHHPDTDGGSTYRIDHVAPGAYAAFAHLVAAPRQSGNWPCAAAFGGQRLQVDDHAGKLTDFADLPTHPLRVRVEDTDGRPVRAAEVAIRDPMHECWLETIADHSSIAGAAFPPPKPPAVRVDDQGRATLPGVRAGPLELLVRRDDGRVHGALLDVDPRHELTLRLQ